MNGAAEGGCLGGLRVGGCSRSLPVNLLELNGRQVPDRGVQPAVVVPVDPAGDLPLDLAAAPPGGAPSLMDSVLSIGVDRELASWRFGRPGLVHAWLSRDHSPQADRRARSGRVLGAKGDIHLSARWPQRTAWSELFNRACGPPPARATDNPADTDPRTTWNSPTASLDAVHAQRPGRTVP